MCFSRKTSRERLRKLNSTYSFALTSLIRQVFRDMDYLFISGLFSSSPYLTQAFQVICNRSFNIRQVHMFPLGRYKSLGRPVKKWLTYQAYICICLELLPPKHLFFFSEHRGTFQFQIKSSYGHSSKITPGIQKRLELILCKQVCYVHIFK